MADDRTTARLKREVSDNAKGRCEYCQSQIAYSPDPFSVEHIQPRADGGTNALDNLALSCHGCNGHKHSKTEALDPIGRERVSLFHPRQQTWSEHFEWSDNFTLIIGLTPVGRATVQALKMNRPGVVNLRGVLYAAGRHPPDGVEEGSN